MLTFNEIVTFAYESEYETAYDLSKKKNFSTPKIYTAHGDLTKRWYVYFSFRNPETGKLKRLTPFYGNANIYKTKEERLEALTTYRRSIIKLLKKRYNPFKDNTELHNSLKENKSDSEKIKPIENTKPVEVETSEKSDEETKMDLNEAFDFALLYFILAIIVILI